MARAVLVWLMLTSACVSVESRVRPTAITGRAAPGDSFCADFTLSLDQARSYFERAQPLTAPHMHDDFQQLPCSVNGVGTRAGRPLTWEIEAGGVGRITQDGVTTLTGCHCDDLFGAAPP